ncbi:MAG: hypothetical protein V3V99_11600 [candidate division Zixibacteria bacterium]
MGNVKRLCDHCGNPLEVIGGLPICPQCNDNRGEYYNSLTSAINDFAQNSDMVLIECPGATLYHKDSNEVEVGAKYIDNNDPTQGYEIIKRPVHGPRHVKKRWVKKNDAHLIRRCQSCQDYTVRMRRKEGPDLYIPSRNSYNHRQFNHPKR